MRPDIKWRYSDAADQVRWPSWTRGASISIATVRRGTSRRRAPRIAARSNEPMATRRRILALPALCWSLIAPAAIPLPAQAPDRHLGAASCASSVCHGAVQPPARPGALMNEFVTWSHEDSHAKAYQALSSPQGRSIAAKLGLGSAETAKICLDCHTDNVPQNQRGNKF